MVAGGIETPESLGVLTFLAFLRAMFSGFLGFLAQFLLFVCLGRQATEGVEWMILIGLFILLEFEIG
jgi:hypothetical protein